MTSKVFTALAGSVDGFITGRDPRPAARWVMAAR